ncbi:MAG: precorrin-6y C5,15-methyltransferase (decarboxylating) subunit CbiE [Candidatus Bathyarchaeota archaeon]|nr:precorrin-6y C5,15-methyltransferase (decarboxylating) subunit CbiE [Candidatus Bathyarchaeota archaeon]
MTKLTIVGVGPGSPDYVIPAARKAVQDAQIVIGSERSLLLFQEEIQGEAVELTSKNLEDVLKYAQAAEKKGKKVVLLSTGDPGFSGLLGSVLSRIYGKNEVTVIPGVSSIQVCAARLGMCWEDAVLFTFHNGVEEKKKEALFEAVKAAKAVFLLPEPKMFKPADIAAFLIKKGVDQMVKVVVCENLTLTNERVVESTLAEAAQQSFSPLCVMVIQGKNLPNG